MPEELDLEQLLAANQHISREKLQEAMELLRKIRELGVSSSTYDLVPPHAYRRVLVGKDRGNDPRILHLGRMSPK